MNDIVMFEVEIDAECIQENFPLIFEAELMFADMLYENEAVSYSGTDAIVEFKNVSQRSFRLNHATRGVHEYIALIFDENHSCLTNVMLHSCLKEFNFASLGEKLPVSAINSFFFPEKSKYIGALQTDKLYDRFVEPLCHSLDTLRRQYYIFMSLCSGQTGFGLEIATDMGEAFSERVQSHDPDRIAEKLILEMYERSQDILTVLNKMYELIRTTPRQILEHLITEHSENMRSAFGES